MQAIYQNAWQELGIVLPVSASYGGAERLSAVIGKVLLVARPQTTSLKKLRDFGKIPAGLGYHSPAFLSFLIFLLIKSRFNALMCEIKSLPFR